MIHQNERGRWTHRRRNSQRTERMVCVLHIQLFPTWTALVVVVTRCIRSFFCFEWLVACVVVGCSATLSDVPVIIYIYIWVVMVSRGCTSFPFFLVIVLCWVWSYSVVFLSLTDDQNRVRGHRIYINTVRKILEWKKSSGKCVHGMICLRTGYRYVTCKVCFFLSEVPLSVLSVRGGGSGRCHLILIIFVGLSVWRLCVCFCFVW